MKHLLNDLSEEEKNRIREQHRGNAKPFLSEQDKAKSGIRQFTDRELVDIMKALKNGGIPHGLVAQIPDLIMADNGNGWGIVYNSVYFPKHGMKY